MKILILRGKDKSKTATAQNPKAPLTEMKGVPVRVTTFRSAERSHGAEAVVILERGRILSVVASAGEMKLYLSPRALFRCIEPDAPKVVSGTGGYRCAACLAGKHTECENLHGQAAGDEYCDCFHGGDAYPEARA